MDFSNVELTPLLSEISSAKPKSKESKAVRQTKNFESISVTFEHTEININYAAYTSNGTSLEIRNGRSSEKIESIELNSGEIGQLRETIRKEILEQVKSFLGSFFENDPEAVEQVGNGEIPEYFNVDNTARRILNIYFSHYQEGDDKMKFAERAKSIIEQAYGDVGEIVGDLPEIVLETRIKVMQILEDFVNGGDVTDFLQTITK
jgi:hypothetical protein